MAKVRIGLALIVVTLVVVSMGNFKAAVDAESNPDITMEPVEIDSFTCRFTGRTLSTCSSCISVSRVGIAAQADASPGAILTASSVSGTDLNFTLSPDQGCGTTGCRNGNYYQIKGKPTDSGSNTPTCNLLLKVRKVMLTP